LNGPQLGTRKAGGFQGSLGIRGELPLSIEREAVSLPGLLGRLEEKTGVVGVSRQRTILGGMMGSIG
jgi:hypothetical protein